MSSLEDKLRLSLRQTAQEVPPRAVPPLRLPDRRFRPLMNGQRPRRRWGNWMTPLAAAAAVAAVIAASLAVSGSIHDRRPHSRPVNSAAKILASLPPYYVTLVARTPPSIGRQHAVIRATATGAVVATLSAPRPYKTFIAVSGAGNGRTFVLAAAPFTRSRMSGGGTFITTSPTKFFLLRIGSHGRTSLRPLAIPPLAMSDTQIALSPDGSRLAVAGDSKIWVYTLATGSARVWSWTGSGGRITNNAGGMGEVLSWTADNRTLAFQQWVTGNMIDIRLLDATTPGGSLRADSRLMFQWPGDGAARPSAHGMISNVLFGFSAIITPDGSKIVAATVTEKLTARKVPIMSELAFTEFSASTGKVVRVLYPWRLPHLYPGQVQDVLWANSTGSRLIVLAHPPGTKPVKDPASAAGPQNASAAYPIRFGVVTGSRLMPLPGIPASPRPGISDPVW